MFFCGASGEEQEARERDIESTKKNESWRGSLWVPRFLYRKSDTVLYSVLLFWVWSGLVLTSVSVRVSMGNCLERRRSLVDNSPSSQATSGVTKVTISGVTKVTCRSSRSFVPLSPSVPAHGEKYKSGMLPTPRSECDILASPNLKAFTCNELKNATRNFRPDNLLGEGGFGYVYKGWIDEHTLSAGRPGSGMVVAVKKLKPDGFQGHKEWLSEVEHLGQLHHPNLVKLIGYCLEGNNRLLVYEYMPKGSLENHLFRRGARPLSWTIRIKVAIGAARGLSFLHDSEQQVIYRDFKASNILLDSEFNAKLSDFGLAKVGPTGDHTHVSTQVMGTQGYAAPEYMATGRLTTKCDVYSFGVVLLELLSGRRAIDKTKVGVEQNLVDWAKPYLGDKRKLFRIMDTKLEGQYPQKAAFATAVVASQCISEAKLRPQMSQVLAILEQLPVAKSSNSPTSSPLPKSPLRKSHPSPLNMSLRGSPLPSSHMQSPVLKSPRGR